MVREYVLQLPAINCTQATFYNCFAPFIETYQSDSKRYYFSNFPREEVTDECLKWVTQLQDLVDLKSLPPNPSYLIGNTIKSQSNKILYAVDTDSREEIMVSQHKDLDHYEMVYNDDKYDKICIIQVRNLNIYI